MKLELQSTVISIGIVTLAIAVLLVIINIKLRKFDPLSKPTGLVLLIIMGFDFVHKSIMNVTHNNRKISDQLTPYFASVMLYIFLSNIAGLFSLECPTANFSVTLSLAAVSCILIEVYSIAYNGFGRYVKSLFEPMAPFVVMNLISKVSTLASLSLRLFGNIISGGILMSVIYQLFGLISAKMAFLNGFNLIAVVVAPFLHFYFDLFAGVLQTYIFSTLSITFIGKELPSE